MYACMIAVISSILCIYINKNIHTANYPPPTTHLPIYLAGPRITLSGSVMIPASSAKNAVNVIPIKRNGSNRSHTIG